MAKQTKKQQEAAKSFRGKNAALWKGQLCQIVGYEPVTQSSGEVIMCAKIKVLGMPLYQGLRLVLAHELETAGLDTKESLK